MVDFLTFCEITELREVARLMPSLELLQRMSPAVKFLCDGCCYLSISNITQEMTSGHVCGGLSPHTAPAPDRVSLCTPSCLGRLSINVWKSILIVRSLHGQGILGCMNRKGKLSISMYAFIFLCLLTDCKCDQLIQTPATFLLPRNISQYERDCCLFTLLPDKNIYSEFISLAITNSSSLNTCLTFL